MQNRGNEEAGADTRDARNAIAFVADLTGELSRMARQHRFEALAYLLDIARLEAENIRRVLDSDG